MTGDCRDTSRYKQPAFPHPSNADTHQAGCGHRASTSMHLKSTSATAGDSQWLRSRLFTIVFCNTSANSHLWHRKSVQHYFASHHFVQLCWAIKGRPDHHGQPFPLTQRRDTNSDAAIASSGSAHGPHVVRQCPSLLQRIPCISLPPSSAGHGAHQRPSPSGRTCTVEHQPTC